MDEKIPAYKKKQKEFKRKLKQGVKLIWNSAVQGTYNKTFAGPIGSDLI
jgi:hypothetical protein